MVDTDQAIVYIKGNMSKTTIPVVNDEFKCACGISHKLGAYVAAHWSEQLVHTCPSCGAKHYVFRGTVSPFSTSAEKKVQK